ncbi:hypothetical protein [Curvibacter soli]|uniref:hypothetical protein n=1 Tax=Curvibacter soli TaxID=3031331 RepID=UPI003AF13230
MKLASSAYSTSGNSYKFHSVHLARNARLQARVEFAELSMKEDHERTGVKQRMADEFDPPRRAGRMCGA